MTIGSAPSVSVASVAPMNPVSTLPVSVGIAELEAAPLDHNPTDIPPTIRLWFKPAILATELRDNWESLCRRFPLLPARVQENPSLTLAQLLSSPSQSSEVDLCLTGANFDRQVLSGITFAGVKFKDATFQSATLTQCRFNNCELSGSSTSFQGAKLEKCAFNATTVSKADFTDAAVNESLFTESKLQEWVTPTARFTQTKWQGGTLTVGINSPTWVDCTFNDCEFKVFRQKCTSLKFTACRFTDVVIKADRYLGGHITKPTFERCHMERLVFDWLTMLSPIFKECQFGTTPDSGVTFGRDTTTDELDVSTTRGYLTHDGSCDRFSFFRELLSVTTSEDPASDAPQ